MNKDIIGSMLQLLNLVPLASRTAGIAAQAVTLDLNDYEGDVVIISDAKATNGTAPTWDVKIQDSATGTGSWGDVSGAAFTQVTDAGSSAAVRNKIVLKSDACKRYITVVATIGGSNTPTFLGTVCALGIKKYPA